VKKLIIVPGTPQINDECKKKMTNSMHMIHDKIHEKHKFINKLKHETLNLLQFITNLVLCVCVLFFSSFVCVSAYANVYIKTTIMKQNIKMILIAGVPKSQAALVYLITSHHLGAFLMNLAR